MKKFSIERPDFLNTVPEQELIKSYLVYKLNTLRCFTSQNP